MEGNRREKLAEYLFPTYEIMSLMCLDVYPELFKVIPMSSCISSYNLSPKTREKNLKFVKDAINNFLIYNPDYKQLLFEHYKHHNVSIIIYDILIGLVLYVAIINKKYYRMDIFKDKKSICFGQVSILDFV